MSSTPASVQLTGQPGESMKEGTNSEHINLKVVGDRNEMYFKIKRTTQFKKLMDAFCERQNRDVRSFRFLYDGDRIQAHDTPLEACLILLRCWKWKMVISLKLWFNNL
ncbi:2234_t:CDS:2, partial [Racocetra persica]